MTEEQIASIGTDTSEHIKDRAVDFEIDAHQAPEEWPEERTQAYTFNAPTYGALIMEAQKRLTPARIAAATMDYAILDGNQDPDEEPDHDRVAFILAGELLHEAAIFLAIYNAKSKAGAGPYRTCTRYNVEKAEYEPDTQTYYFSTYDEADQLAALLNNPIETTHRATVSGTSLL